MWCKGRHEPPGWHMSQRPCMADTTLQSYHSLHRRLQHKATEQPRAGGFYWAMGWIRWPWDRGDGDGRANYACLRGSYVQELMPGLQDSNVSSVHMAESWKYYGYLFVNNSPWRFQPWSALPCAEPCMNISQETSSCLRAPVGRRNMYVFQWRE